jgi:hypothetical protein
MTINCNDNSTAPRAINLVVSCTNRKKLPPSPELSVHQFNTLNFNARLNSWVANMQKIRTPTLKAEDMYLGDHWSIARSIPKESASRNLVVRLWICSAGYGLISPDTPIKPYRATFSKGQDDYVAVGLALDDPEEASRQWWSRVCSSALEHPAGPRSISELAEQFGNVPMLVVLSADYLMAIRDDLRRAVSLPYLKSHLSIISSGTPSDHPLWKDHLLPSGASLAGTLGGTLTSLNIRVARRLLETLDGAEPDTETLSRLCRSIKRKPLDVPRRRELTDEQIDQFVNSWLRKHPGTSKTPLLAALRRSGCACEQSRFGRIYSSVVKCRTEVRV